MLNLITVTDIFCCLHFIPFIAKRLAKPYSQVRMFNRICLNNELFGSRYNDLEKHLLEKGYSEKMVRKEKLQAKAIPGDKVFFCF